jgi:hypothetical protein
MNKLALAWIGAACLLLPAGLSAQAANPGPSAQTAPSTPGVADTGTGDNTTNQQQAQPNSKPRKKDKAAKVKKSSCVSPPADSGLPDYCKNPYWEPKDWIYILNNSGNEP